MDTSSVSSVQKGFHHESDVSHPQSAGLGRTGNGTSACDHTYPAWYAARRKCCCNAALIGRMFSIARQPCANNSFHTPLGEHVLLYTTTRNLSILSRVSELTSTCCRDRQRKVSVTNGQHLHANHANFFPWPRKLDRVSHPLTAWKHIYAFSLTFSTLIVDCNLAKVSTDAKSNPEFIKPKRREMSYCKDNHICVHGCDYQFANSLPCTMRNVEQNARISSSSWEHGWIYSTSLTRFCVETIVSSFVLMVTFLPVSPGCTHSDI